MFTLSLPFSPIRLSTQTTIYRFNFSHRDIEDLLAERRINVSYEAIRLWCNRFGPEYAARLKKKHQGYGDTFFIDEVFVKMDGKQNYLWRAVGQEGLPHGLGPAHGASFPGGVQCFNKAITRRIFSLRKVTLSVPFSLLSMFDNLTYPHRLKYRKC
jgi:hypothetical protein